MTLTLPEIKMTEGVGFFEFQGLLKDRKIPQHYGIQDLEDDLRNFPREKR
jgi:predicted HTH domain antitoxin